MLTTGVIVCSSVIPTNDLDKENRLRGYARALHKAGIPFNEMVQAAGPFTFEFGYDYLRSGQWNPGITAIFCGNDLIAMGAIKTLKELNLSVPEDISIMGFDDIYLSSMTTPGLTTVRQPSCQLGYLTVQRLVDALEGIQHEESNILINLELVVRESTASPRETKPLRFSYPEKLDSKGARLS